jgi:type I restriction enzyme S subunit
MGQSPSSSSYNQDGIGIPFFQGNADFGDIHPEIRYWCNKPIKIAKANDILISVRAPIGAINIATEECCIGRGLAAITVKEDLGLNKYLYYVLKSRVNDLISNGKGSTFKAINKKDLEDILIPVPSVKEQNQIVLILDFIIKLILLRKRQINALNSLVKSRFVGMFGDPVANPMGWEVAPLSEHLRVIGGYAFSSDGFIENGIPVLRIGNINTGVFSSNNLVFWRYDKKLDRYSLYPGDIVISLTGTVGKEDYANVCILGYEYERYYLNQRNAKLELGATLNSCYLANILRIPKIKGRLTGISRGIRQANVSNSDILKLLLPIPPIALQNRFASFVQKADKTKFVIRQGLEKLELCYKALLQQYFG